MPLYKNARPRGFAAWSPRAASLAIVATVLKVIADEKANLPLTARQVFYRMVANYGYAKTEKSCSNLYEKISRGRRAGLIPWDAIRDDEQKVRHGGGFDGVDDFMSWVQRNARWFKLDPNPGQVCFVEIHVEAAGMVPQVARTASPLGASVYSSGGFGSVTVQHGTALRMAQRNVPTVVLSIGDYDPSGIALYQSFKENVMAFFDEGDWDDRGEWETPLFRRIAVTPDQIRQYGFITAPPKSTDNRGSWSGGTVQCEAIPTAQLGTIVHDAILEHYDIDVINSVDTLSKSLRPGLQAKVGGIDVSELEDRCVDEMETISDDCLIFPMDWQADHENEDDDDMEEGV